MKHLNIRHPIRRRHVFLLLLAGAAVFRILMTLGPRTVTIYYDELFYLELAQNLWQGAGLKVYAVPVHFTKILYPLVLSPCYAIPDAAARMTVIGIVNALLVASALIPGYLLACRLLKKDSHILLAVLLLAAAPDMGFSMTYMAENLYLPLLLWGFYFACRAFRKEDGSPVRFLLPGFWAFLLYAAKEAGAAFPAGMLLLLLGTLVRNRKDSGKRRKHLAELGCFVLAFAAPAVLVRFTLLQGIGYSYRSQVSFARLSSAADWGFLLTSALELLLIFGISCCYVPAAYPPRNRDLSPAARQQRSLAFLYILCVAVGTAFGVSLAEREGTTPWRIYLRYFIGAFYPLLLCFFAGEGRDRPASPDKREKILACVFSGVFLLGVILLVPRPRVGALSDSPAYYFNNLLACLPAGEALLKGLTCLAVLGALVLWTFRRKALLPAAAALLLALSLFNSALFIPAARKDYAVADPAVTEEARQMDDCLGRLDGSVAIIYDDQEPPETIRTLTAWLRRDCMMLVSNDLRATIRSVTDASAISLRETPLRIPLYNFNTETYYLGRNIDLVLLLDPSIELIPEKYEDITPDGFTLGKLYRSLDPCFLCLRDPDLYTPGDVLSFRGSEANFRRYTVSGFSPIEDSHTWTLGNEASIRLKPDLEAPVSLMLSWSWLDTIGPQRCRIRANETLLFDGVLEGGGQMELTIPASCCADRSGILLRFELPDAREPSEYDRRVLAVAFTELSLTPAAGR